MYWLGLLIDLKHLHLSLKHIVYIVIIFGNYVFVAFVSLVHHLKKKGFQVKPLLGIIEACLFLRAILIEGNFLEVDLFGVPVDVPLVVVYFVIFLADRNRQCHK